MERREPTYHTTPLIPDIDHLTVHCTDAERQAIKAILLKLVEQKVSVEQQLAWFKKALFGRKSEKRLFTHPNQLQLPLVFAQAELPELPPAEELVVYKRNKPKKKSVQFVDDESRLKFDSSVPVRVIEVENPAIKDLAADEYEVIGEEVTHRLAQRRSAYEIVKYVRKVVRLKGESTPIKPPTPEGAFQERSFMDVSFASGMIVDKIAYHKPLHRIHQHLTSSGVYVNRSTLTRLFLQSADEVKFIYRAVIDSVLESLVLAMDETTVKATRENNKMKQCYVWSMYGDKDEVAYVFSRSRSGSNIPQQLKGYRGVLLCDGYEPYETYSKNAEEVARAQCWSHGRRKFSEAEDSEPSDAKRALFLIGELYRIEDEFRNKTPEERLEARQQSSKPLVDMLFNEIRTLRRIKPLLRTSALYKALTYFEKREEQFRLFLSNPYVQIDTNHLERELRAIAIGRKNWMFCWTEEGAQAVCILQTLVACCKLHGVNPYDYFVDIFQRIKTHPITEISLLTPRLWKEHFAHQAFKSVLEEVVHQV